jgi:FemAB-related protein (PEP-CTERM system-associated)
VTAIAQQSEPKTTAADVAVEQPAGKAEWNEFVLRFPRSIFHRADWRSVWKVYGLQHHDLVAREKGQIVGVLPLVLQNSPMIGRQLVSLPWFDAAGPLTECGTAASALVEAALSLADRLRARWVQIRCIEPRPVSPYVRTDKVLMELGLQTNPDALWKGLDPKVRNQVRKAEKSGLVVCSGGPELIGDYFHVYVRNMRDLGSPSHSRAFFDAVAASFGAETRIWVVRLDGRPVGAGFTMANGTALEIPWASSLKDFNKLCVNHLMYWKILERACDDGFQVFRFGRSSTSSGTYHFKKQWGAKEVPLYWYFLSRKPVVAEAAATPPQESFGWASRAWQKLPLGVSKRLGPKLIAGIP